jgi:hypothetical protein
MSGKEKTMMQAKQRGIRLTPFSVYILILISTILVAPVAANPRPQTKTARDHKNPAPEMDRLAKLLVGDWRTTETMERCAIFPDGGGRRGIAHIRLAAGGTTLLYEVHSDGSAGKLDGMLVIWWDKEASLYQFFVCFNNPNHPCKTRGTAHWEGNSFVNDYEEIVEGKRTPCRDSFTFTPTSHTLVAAMEVDGGSWQTQITTRAIRR